MMHTDNNIGYPTVHLVFIRKSVKTVKEGDGQPFVAVESQDAAYPEQPGYSNDSKPGKPFT
ncbi:MAG: hypothetical protein JXA13_15860 [Anaerolineales bacterium]|nr:hypothetical protein [Anaerolineales bacterium]